MLPGADNGHATTTNQNTSEAHVNRRCPSFNALVVDVRGQILLAGHRAKPNDPVTVLNVIKIY